MESIRWNRYSDYLKKRWNALTDAQKTARVALGNTYAYNSETAEKIFFYGYVPPELKKGWYNFH